MEPKTRIRINLNTREIEFEGSENFIEKYQEVINEFIDKIRGPQTFKYDDAASTSAPKNPIEINNLQPTNSILPDSFGEYYTKFPRNIKVIDKILIASFFVQAKSDDNLFSPKEAADLLTEQNVQITNASAFIKALVNTGKLFKHAGKYKVSEKGVEQITQLFNSSNN